jgi:hypothetical protein
MGVESDTIGDMIGYKRVKMGMTRDHEHKVLKELCASNLT